MVYSSKRQAFLVDQGYAFKVITHLQGIESLPDLAFTSPLERRELLQNIMIHLETDTSGDIEATDDLFDRVGKEGGAVRIKKKKPARRQAGTLSELAGGQDMSYVEQNRSKNKDLKKAQSNPFFKKVRREAEKKKAAWANDAN